MKHITLAVLLFFLVWGSLNVDNRAFAQNSIAASPLRLKLSTTTPTTCFGKSLEVQAELVNESSERVVIDTKTIWYRVSFSMFRSNANRNSGGSLTSVADGGPGYEGEYLVLNPGESYKTSRTFSLENEFFSSLGSYKIKVSYGQFLDKSFEGITAWIGSINSDDLSFKIIDCKQMNPQAPIGISRSKKQHKIRKP